MFNILLLNKLTPRKLERLRPELYNFADDAAFPDGIVLRSADLHGDGAIPPSVLAIARAGAGVNNIPIELCTERGIPVFNTPGANANAVKELVIGALYLSSRNVADAIDWVDTIADKGDEIPALVEKGKSKFVGPEVSGKRLGIIGLGAVGVQVANTAVHLGMEVMGYDPYISVEAAWGLSRSVHHSLDINEIYKNCDYITIHVPLNDDTRGSINRETIALMKPGVRILNFARGGLVVSADMLEAVKDGRVACYVTDFPDKLLVGQKNIVTIPHLGASTFESEDNCSHMAARELAHYLERGSIRNSVNFPDCELSGPAKGRVTIINKNIPGMLSAITSLASDCGYNIDNLVNKSKKGSSAAYTVIDLDAEPSEDFLAKLSAIEGITRVRVIQ